VDASVTFTWLIPDAAEEDVPAAKALLVDHSPSSSSAFLIPTMLGVGIFRPVSLPV